MDDLPKDDQEKTTTKTKPIEIGELDGRQSSSPPNIDQSKEPKSELETQLEKDKESIPKTAPAPEPEIDKKEPEVKPATITDIKEEPIKTDVQQTAEEKQSSSTLPQKKGKNKIKNISAILSLLVIIIALPLSLLLVKQRQEIRKQAEVSGGLNVCGIKIERPSENYSAGTYSIRVKLTNTNLQSKQVEIHTYACACPEPRTSSQGCNKCQGKSKKVTIGAGQSITEVISARQPNGSDCGSFQADLFIVSVDGNTMCSNN